MPYIRHIYADSVAKRTSYTTFTRGDENPRLEISERGFLDSCSGNLQDRIPAFCNSVGVGEALPCQIYGREDNARNVGVKGDNHMRRYAAPFSIPADYSIVVNCIPELGFSVVRLPPPLSLSLPSQFLFPRRCVPLYTLHTGVDPHGFV